MNDTKSNDAFLFLADLGAEEICIRRSDTEKLSNVQYFIDYKNPNEILSGAGGETLPISAIGDVNSLIRDAFVVDNVDVNVIGTNKLPEQGIWFIQPPTSVSPNHAGFFVNSDGKLLLRCNEKLITNVNEMNSYNSFINLPGISCFIPNTSTTTLIPIEINDTVVSEVAASIDNSGT